MRIKKRKKITIPKSNSRSNMKIMGVHMRQSSAVIIGDTHEPVIYEIPQERTKKKEKK